MIIFKKSNSIQLYFKGMNKNYLNLIKFKNIYNRKYIKIDINCI